MVSKKSIYYERFDGIQDPRSLKRSPQRKSTEGSKICAFDLLVAVADQLLEERESSISSTSPKRKLEPTLIESPHSDNDSGLEHVSDVKTSGFLENIVKLEPCEGKNVDLCDFNLFNNIAEIQENGDLTVKDPMESCVNTCVLNKSYTSVNLPLKMGISRDGDENSFKLNHHDTKLRESRAQKHAGYRRIRKMLTSRYRKKVTVKKDYELANCQDRCQTEVASKRRKLFHEKSGNVKFSIKSFKVPELYIDIPETATVGSLKRSVMEAVSAILGGKLHVGILVKGKKVKDNNRTLQQTGISQDSNLETLGFTLEPIPSPIKKEEMIQKNQEIIPLQMENELIKEGMADSKVPMPFSEALPLVAVNHQLTKKCEGRRIRRPFSVSEVEALVEAVETLGTGRWRDIKLRAFDEANNRTYVDLKDKWKTLVHTAKISPQQRRGEPVPQDLLDRVMAAHSYWSQHQRKHPSKPV